MKIKTRMLMSMSIPFITSIILIFSFLFLFTFKQVKNELNIALRNQTIILKNNISKLIRISARSYIKAIGDYADINLTSLNINENNFLSNGYVYLVDINGIIIDHPDKTRIGTTSVVKEWLLTTNKTSAGFNRYKYQDTNKLVYKKYNKKFNIYIMTSIYTSDYIKAIEIEDFDKFVSKTKVPKIGYPVIISNEGKIVSHPNKLLINRNVKDLKNTDGKLFYKNITSKQKGEFTYTWETEGKGLLEKIIYYIHDKDSKYIFGTIAFTANYQNKIKKIFFVITISTLAIVLLTLIVILKISNTFTKPIIALSEFSVQLTNGVIETNIPKCNTDEINSLTEKFIFMGKTIQEKIDELSKNKTTLELKVHERTKELQSIIKKLNETQEQLIQSEKMSSLGSLVAGVAHEINTPIGIGVTISSHIESEANILLDKYKNGLMSKPIFENFMHNIELESKILLTNMNKAANLINSFKQVSVDQSIEEKRVFNINNYVKDLLLSLNHKIKNKNISIKLEIDKDLKIYSYPGALSQIFTNLILNSYIHGFNNRTSGEIVINITKIENEIKITYKDNGVGIDKSIIDKIYDPFFTTKRSLGGTGLGLHLVYNITYSTLEGTIKCISDKAIGTEFIINFLDTLK